MFEKFGECEKINIIREPGSQISRKFGFVKFFQHDDAQKAIDKLQNSIFFGKSL